MIDIIYGESNVVKKQAAVVDIFKFLFSICILAFHTKIVHNFPVKLQWYIIHLIFRLGVPFFFCTSGYFLGCKLWSDTNSDDVFEKYIRKMILPFLVWGGIGLIQYDINYTSFIRELRGLSMCIYFTHRCFINIVRPWVKNEIELFCAVLVLSTLVYIIKKLSKVEILDKII